MIEVIPIDVEIPKKVPIVPDAYYTRKEIEEMGICGWLTLFRHERNRNPCTACANISCPNSIFQE